MNMEEYQVLASDTAQYPGRMQAIGYKGLIYTIMGLSGEAGEVANKLKKMIRNELPMVTDKDADGLIDELGDVLWYVSQAAMELGVSLDDVARRNVEKLAKRKIEGTIKNRFKVEDF